MEPAAQILIVDDNEQNRTLLRVILQRHGYNTRLSQSGEEALFLDCIHAADGDINETAGDGFMAILHDANLREHARKAAHAALAVLAATATLNREHGAPPLAMHIGINSGLALVGSTRFEGLHGPRWTFTASGPVTNLAARLGAAAVPGTILVGPETAKRIEAGFLLEPCGPQALKNLEAVEVYRLVREK
jgi:class 3 adenylate cyclase